MQTTDITFTSGPIRLAGTLVGQSDGQPGPACLLVSGSGPLDRDSNTKRLSIDVMGQIAEHLGRSGIVTLRYDKRGVGASEGDYLTTGFHDNVADARAALNALRARPEVDGDQIFVIGHSEGALIATELAAGDRTLEGAVLLAGAAVDGERVLRWQGAQVAATLPRPITWLLKLLRKDVVRTQAKRLDQIKATTDDTVRIQFVKLNARWFREFMAHDPAPSLRSIEIPVLAVAGAKDLQVDPGDAARICRLVPADCSHHVVDDLTHLLRRDPGPPTVRTYKKQAKRPVEPDLLDLITSWIADRTMQAEVPTPDSGRRHDYGSG